MQRLLPILLCLICTGFSQQAAAWGALGCDYGINVPAFVSCVTTSAKTQADTAVTNATTGLNATIEELQNSPLLAAAGIEQTMLNILRKNEIQALAQCLNNANTSLLNVANATSSNPTAIVKNRLEHMMRQSFSADHFQARVHRLRNTSLTATQNLNSAINSAFDEMINLANEDPLTKCAIPILQAQNSLIKQAAGQLYPILTELVTARIDTVLKPALAQNIDQMLLARFQELSGQTVAASGAQRYQPAKSSSSQITKPYTRAQQQQPSRRAQTQVEKSKAQAQSSQRTLANPVRKRAALRTRDIQSFLREQADNIATGAQDLIAASVPETATLVATGELMRQALPPELINEGASALNAVAASLNANTDLTDLERIINRLSLSNQAMFSHIALTTISYYGHEALDTGGEFVVKHLMGLIVGAKDVPSELISGLCSSGWIPTGFLCSAVKTVFEIAYDELFLPTAGHLVSLWMHAEWDRAIACGAQNIDNPSFDVADCTILTAVVGWLPNTSAEAVEFAMPFLGETHTALLTYHQAVLQLAQAAQSRSRR